MAESIKLSDYDFTDLKNYPNVGYLKNGDFTELSFNGNSLIRPYNSKLAITEEAQREWQKCKDDKFYFFNNYCKIQTLDHGIIDLSLRVYQQDFIDLIHNNRKVIGMCSRQTGKTTTNALYIVWNMCFQKDWTAAIVTDEDDLIKEIVSKVKEIYELLPAFLQDGIKTWNAKSFKLNNGCRLISAIASASAHRGKSLNFLLVDETAWIDGNKFKSFVDSVMPALSSGTNTKIVMISTPNGFNHFYRMWQESLKGLEDGFKTFTVDWRCIPERDEKWKENELANLMSDGCSYEEAMKKFLQNHHNKFIGSSHTLLSAKVLEKLEKQQKFKFDTYPDAHVDFKIYEEPITDDENIYYTVGGDSAKISPSSAKKSDYISIQVIKIDKEKGNITQVATLKTKDLHYTEMSSILNEIGKYYNNALVLIENNSEGQAIVDDLFENFEYDNIYSDDNRYDINGFRTTVKSKRIGLSNLERLINQGKFELRDLDTIDEFFTFVKKGSSYAAVDSDAHDDAIMALVACIQFMNSVVNDVDMSIRDFLDSEYENAIGESDDDDEDSSSTGLDIIISSSSIIRADDD